MSKQVRARSEAGYQTHAQVAGYDIHIDATREEHPDTLDVLLADYAACYVPALRVGGEQRGVDDLGEITIDVTGEINDDGKLSSVSFDINVEAELDDDTATQIVDRANALCKVHDALKDSLKADVSLTGS